MTITAKNRHTEAHEPHWVEWVTGIVSALIVFLMIAWIAKEAWMEDGAPPEFSIEVTGRGAAADGYRVEFDIANRATTTAAAVVVRGEIVDGGEVAEDAEVTFDYVPAESKSSGALLFSQDPGAREVRIRTIGYIDP
ncbi:TIGR02588 family protein [Rhizobium sp. LCM 4573]|uniref:TIGR02588 family protein n=1 Tax=Rhizobium sp. LCM 4573 TaxID=1848291 RepID=UPI0008DB164D|nr:TIGR02588 family protein [Rhizobium sp. LCM 4573]OHV82269.1 TIGR02588 family protein [Rhizobium sp. LCM 4573]